MPLYSFEGLVPRISESAYIAPTAVIIGDVIIGKRCYVGFGVTLRGDWGTIDIGDETAVEEDVFVHARPKDVTRIGNSVTLGHGCIIHNATIEDGATIGMNAVVSDFSTVGARSIVGEMSLVRRSQTIPPGKIVLGSPAKEVGDVDDDRLEKHRRAKDLYANLADRCNRGAIARIPEPWAAEGGVTMAPIGVIRTPFVEAKGTPIQGALGDRKQGDVALFPWFREGLKDLDGMSHVVLIYAFDRADPAKLSVTPYLDNQERGIFATRSPTRPNPIGMTVVRLDEVDDATLRVTGVDMLDETPLLDIKPYVPAFDNYDEVKTGWFSKHLGGIKREETEVLADDRFHRQSKAKS